MEVSDGRDSEVMSGARRLVARAVGSAGVHVWLAALSLFTTPYILLHLGTAAYGVFAMVSIVSAHLSNLELGFGHATVRYVARARAVSDPATERRVLDTSLAVFLAGGLVGGLLLFSGAPFLVGSFFNVPAQNLEASLQSFRIGGLILAGSFLVTFFSAALQALGRFGWLNGSRAVFGTLAAVAAVGVVAAGGGLVGVFAAQAVVVLLSCLAQGFALRRARGESARPRVHRRTFREMAAFGSLVFAAGLAYQWMINGPPVVLAARVSSAEIPAFSVPHMVLQKLTLLVSSASMAFYPFASAASADADRTALAAVFRSHVRLTVLAMGPIAAFLGVFARPLLQAWVDPAFSRAATPCLQFLAAAALLLALSGPPADVARGLGRPSWVLLYTTAVAVLSVGASFFLVPRWRAAGAAFAFLLGQVFLTVPFLVLVTRRLLGLRFATLAHALAGPVATVLAVALTWSMASSYLQGLVPILLAGAAVSGVYAAVVHRWVLDARERQALLRALRPAA